MSKKLITISIYLFGWLLIICGVIAGFIPLIPGIVLVVAGFYVISLRSAWIKTILDKVRAKYPKVDARIRKLEVGARKMWDTVFKRT